MCGIAGLYSFNPLDSRSLGPVRRMSESISRRGPDDEGVWEDDNIFLVHRRLSIVDTSRAGHQPMLSECGRYVIVFNGEIYNHLSLRSSLEGAGEAPAWRGHSDTETLLACFVSWGVERTLRSLVGMFAFALWDRRQRTLTLARDRFGEKPLYWGWQGDKLLFGSELKALKAHPACGAVVDRGALGLLLRFGYIPAPSSIYRGIVKLPCGHYVSISAGPTAVDAQPRPYWRLNEALEQGLKEPFPGTDLEAVSALEHQLSVSIADQMLADVPLGAFLSGGVDSSTVVALMQRQSMLPVRTFAIGFDEPGYNEAAYAKEVAQYLGTDHTELYVGAADALAVIPKLPSIYCEPFADSSQIPTYLVSEMARRHVTVALSGDAGDELFGGYNPYQFAPRIWKRLERIPLPLRKIFHHVLSKLPLHAKLAKLNEVITATSSQDFYRSLLSHWLHPEQIVIGAKEPTTLLNSPPDWPTVDSFEHWMMALDAQTYMCDDILVKVDRAAMANSLETRVPMLDHRVVELAWRLPLSMKIRNGQGKWVLRQVLYRHVPRELIERPKKGFSIPLGRWLRGPLRDWAEALLDANRLKHEGYFNPAPIHKVWQDHLQGRRDHSTRLWSILMFQAWLEVQ